MSGDPQPLPLMDWAAKMEAMDKGKARRARNWFLIAYLVIQLTLPLRGFIRSKLDSRGDFSWNMYSQLYACNSRYVLLTPDGRGVLIDEEEYARIPERISTVFRRDWLPVFNHWLCRQLHSQGKRGQLKARIGCRHDLGPLIELVEPYSLICQISEQGITRP